MFFCAAAPPRAAQTLLAPACCIRQCVNCLDDLVVHTCDSCLHLSATVGTWCCWVRLCVQACDPTAGPHACVWGAGTVEAGAGKRKRGDDMADLEAQLDDAAAAAPAAAEGGTRLSGFVSAGVIQQTQPAAANAAPAGAALAAAPAAGATPACWI